MKKKHKKILKYGLGGLVALGSISYFMNPPALKKKETEKLGIYIEKPIFISKGVEKLLDTAVEIIDHSDYSKSGFNGPNAFRVTYPDFGDRELRVTGYYRNRSTLNLFGNVSEGCLVVEEKRIGNDAWQFDQMYLGGKDMSQKEIEGIKKKIPWIVHAAENKEPYIVRATRNAEGRVVKLVYELTDGERVTLEDTDGNSIADIISNSP